MIGAGTRERVRGVHLISVQCSNHIEFGVEMLHTSAVVEFSVEKSYTELIPDQEGVRNPLILQTFQTPARFMLSSLEAGT